MSEPIRRLKTSQYRHASGAEMAQDVSRLYGEIIDERDAAVRAFAERLYRSTGQVVTAAIERPVLRFGELAVADTRPGDVAFNLPRAKASDGGRFLGVLKRYNNNAFNLQTLDGSLINGSYQRVENFTQLGLHLFFWDGFGWWFLEPAARTRLPEPTPDTVGLWNMAGNAELTDSSGNGFTLTVETGTLFNTRLDAHLHGVYFDGSTALWHNVSEAALRLTGDMTFLCFWVNHTAVTNARLVSHEANGALEADNCLYSFGYGTYPNAVYRSETGASVSTSHTAATLLSMPGQLTRVGFTRISGVVQFWHQGKKIGAASSAFTTPTGGSSGRFRLGASSTVRTNGAMAGALLAGTGWSDAQMIADYQRTMGLVHGFVSEI